MSNIKLTSFYMICIIDDNVLIYDELESSSAGCLDMYLVFRLRIII